MLPCCHLLFYLADTLPSCLNYLADTLPSCLNYLADFGSWFLTDDFFLLWGWGRWVWFTFNHGFNQFPRSWFPWFLNGRRRWLRGGGGCVWRGGGAACGGRCSWGFQAAALRLDQTALHNFIVKFPPLD